MIVLMTDFGAADPYAGIMKGVIKGISPASDIIDLTHDIPPQNIPVGYFVLKHSCMHFPRGTVFAAVVDPGVGTSRKAIAVKTKDFIFLGPDNGILGFVREEGFGLEEIREIANREYFYRKEPGTTFHGRDVFAPVAAHIDRGADFESLGRNLDSITTMQIPARRITEKGVEIPLLHIDHFGNMIYSITEDDFRGVTRNGDFTLTLMGHAVTEISEHYRSDHPLIALFNSYGLLEIAAPSGNAASMVGLAKGATGEQVYVRLLIP